jgi:tetratricopeptide (TPR) repeat protein
MSDDLFRQGLSAAKAGDLATAQKLFTEVLRKDPLHVNAWVALGHCQTDPEKKKYCFTKVLSLDPDHEIANRLLQELERQSSPIYEEESAHDDLKNDPSRNRLQSKRPRRPTARIAVAAVGCILGFILVGGLFYLLNPGISTIIDPIAQAIFPGNNTQTSIAPANTPQSAWSKTPTSSPALNISPSTTQAPSRAQLLSVSYPDVTNAIDYMKNGNYTQAILVWDKVIDAMPDYAAAYFYRGACYLELLANQRFLDEYRENAEQSYADLTTAIELDPTIGDYYSKRVDAIYALAGVNEFRVDRQPLYDQILDDTLQAFNLGSNFAWGNRSVGMALLDDGYCEKSLDYFLQLEAENEADDRTTTPSGAIPRFIGQSYFCLGQNDKALAYNEVAIENMIANGVSTYAALIDKVYILYSMGRYPEALEILDTWIEEDPYYRGLRYYLRALLYYELDQPDLAYEDIDFGLGNTWGQYGVRAYVLGLLALDEGDEETGLYWLQLAEASLSEILEKNLLENARAEIERLGGTYITPTPTSQPDATSTPIPAISDYTYFTPTPPGQIPFPIKQANYLGSGMVFLRPGEMQVLMFRPYGYHTIHEVVSLSLEITADEWEGDIPIMASFLPFDNSNMWKTIELTDGENIFTEPQLYVNSEGYFYVMLAVPGNEPIVILNIRVRLDTVLPDGTQISYGYTEDG